MANNENLIPIPGRLHSVASEGHVAGADEIYDDTQAKTQETINSEVNTSIGTDSTSGSIKGRIKSLEDEVGTSGSSGNSLNSRVSTLETAVGSGGSVDSRIATAKSEIIGDAAAGYDTLGELEDKIQEEATARTNNYYTKSETYNKTELDNMITTPEVDYVNVTATSSTTAVTDVLPATGAADTIYKVGNWDGTQYNTGKYTEYSWNGSAYVQMAVRDHGVDDVPTAGSDNLVKSGGVLTGTVSGELKQYLETDNIKDTLDAIVLDVDRGFDENKDISATEGTIIDIYDSIISQYISAGTTFELIIEDNNNVLANGIIFLYIKVNGGWNAPTLLEKNIVKRWTSNANITDLAFKTNSPNVASGTVKFGIKYEDIHKAEINKRIEEFAEDNDLINAKNFVSEYGLDKYENNVMSAIVGGDMALPRLQRNFDNYAGSAQLYKVDDDFLQSQGLNIIDANKEAKSSGENVKVSRFWYPSVDDICNLIIANRSKYIRLQFYIYSKHEDFPIINNRSSAEFYSGGLSIVSPMTSLEDTTSPKVKKATFNIPTNNLSTTVPFLLLSFNVTASEAYNAGEFGYTGLKIGFFDDAAEAGNKDIIGDWEFDDLDFPIKRNYLNSDSFADYINYGKQGVYFNKVKDTREQIDMFIKRYKGKYVDEYNRLLVSVNGDSIFSAQLSFVEDCADKATGAFPPNMSKKIIARLFYDKYKFSNEDTAFRNITHSAWTKVGFNISRGDNDSAQTFNEIEAYGCNEGDYAQIRINGYRFLKVVWSEYRGIAYSFEIQRSSDNGTTFTTVDTINVDTTKKRMVAYKIYDLGNAQSVDYIYKIVPTSAYSDVCFWGVEMWNNPRLDVVVEAVSGSTAKDNYNHLGRFYDNNHKPALILMDIFALNDHVYPINDWLGYLSQIYNFIQDKGIPLIAFNTHNPTIHKYPNFSIGTVKVRNIPNVDILSKRGDIHYSPEQGIVGSDGLHLNTYGNKYYFEELEKIFDDVLLDS